MTSPYSGAGTAALPPLPTPLSKLRADDTSQWYFSALA